MNADWPKICRLAIYPIKSLDGHELDEARVLSSGGLANDRRWVIVDAQGQWVNGKRTRALHPIRATYSPAIDAVTLQSPQGPAQSFQLPRETAEVAAWLSAELGFTCRLIENAAGGFPDDSDASGPTLISTASLAAVARWFEGLDAEELRRRVRANLEIDASEPFWEDRLGDDGLSSPLFRVGSVLFRGRTICQRCIVPTRSARTGESTARFAHVFAAERQRTLPAWSPTEQFDHYYRLALNTSLERAAADAVIRVGDAVSIMA